jgi:hypothetical protein
MVVFFEAASENSGFWAVVSKDEGLGHLPLFEFLKLGILG